MVDKIVILLITHLCVRAFPINSSMPGRRSYVATVEPLAAAQMRRKRKGAYYCTSHSVVGKVGNVGYHPGTKISWSDCQDGPWTLSDPWSQASSCSALAAATTQSGSDERAPPVSDGLFAMHRSALHILKQNSQTLNALATLCSSSLSIRIARLPYCMERLRISSLLVLQPQSPKSR